MLSVHLQWLWSKGAKLSSFALEDQNGQFPTIIPHQQHMNGNGFEGIGNFI